MLDSNTKILRQGKDESAKIYLTLFEAMVLGYLSGTRIKAFAVRSESMEIEIMTLQCYLLEDKDCTNVCGLASVFVEK